MTEESNLGNLKAEVSELKARIDALDTADQRAPWYKQVPVVVSVMVSIVALIFSLGTTVLSERRLAREDAHATRAELRSLIQRLSVLPKENFELTRAYQSDPSAVYQLSSLINAENVVLAKQAAELIERIPDQVTATEYYAVAVALGQSAVSRQSGELLARGLEVAEDAQEKTTLLREYGNYLYSTGDVDGGREKYGQAMDVFDEDPERSKDVTALSHLYTQIGWAQAEFSKGDCGEARRHHGAAVRYSLEVDGVAASQLVALDKRIMERCG